MVTHGDPVDWAWRRMRRRRAAANPSLGSHRLPDLLDWGDELSARHAKSSSAGTWDFVHVAAAQHARAQAFITCDAAQAKLARLAGLTQVQLFK